MSTTQDFNQVLKDWVQIFMRNSMHGFTDWMSDNDLSRSQVGALMMIHHHQNCQITMIGENLDISTPAASQLVDRLVQRELIERTDDIEDRRAKNLGLTDKGIELIHQNFKARLSWTENLAEQLSDSEKEQISQSFKILIKNTKDLGKGNKKMKKKKIIIRSKNRDV